MSADFCRGSAASSCIGASIVPRHHPTDACNSWLIQSFVDSVCRLPYWKDIEIGNPACTCQSHLEQESGPHVRNRAHCSVHSSCRHVQVLSKWLTKLTHLCGSRPAAHLPLLYSSKSILDYMHASEEHFPWRTRRSLSEILTIWSTWRVACSSPVLLGDR